MPAEPSTESAGAPPAARRTLLVGSVVLAVAVVAILGLRFLGGVLLGGAGARTPEALFEDLRNLGARGDWTASWSRVHPDEQAEFRRAIDEMRVFLERNPGATRLAEQFHCSYEEFRTLPYRDLYALASTGWEGSLAEARVVRREDATDVPGDVLVHWVTSYGDDETMRARKSGDGLWYVIKLKN